MKLRHIVKAGGRVEGSAAAKENSVCALVLITLWGCKSVRKVTLWGRGSHLEAKICTPQGKTLNLMVYTCSLVDVRVVVQHVVVLEKR